MIPILLTGFGRWDQLQYNPSGVVARALDGVVLSGAAYGSAVQGRVDARVLDVAWESGEAKGGGHVESAVKALVEDVAILRPRILVNLGVQARHVNGFDVEYCASDLSNTEALDVRGLPSSSPRHHASDPQLLIMPLPQRPIIEALRKAGYMAESDPGMGNFLCEQVGYESARLARLKGTSLLRAGFIHIFNPMSRAVALGHGEDRRYFDKPDYALTVSELDAAERKVFDAAEQEIIAGIRIALEVCLGSLPADVETNPKPWKYLDTWMPEMEFKPMR